ncbi:hypothetical protein [Gorillibacterium timonense]|uniref:hypothetical protein n=1 Tax=Gorillibacterium timonense TaxID=1689269 RepID=UPI0011DCA8E7|nr:hypothetical protein [Gorillibacterium timonense]
MNLDRWVRTQVDLILKDGIIKRLQQSEFDVFGERSAIHEYDLRTSRHKLKINLWSHQGIE